MSAMSPYLQNRLLDHVLRGDEPDTSFTQPSEVYVSLHDGEPNGTGENEIEGGGYMRQQAHFEEPSNGVTMISDALVFEGLTATTVTWIGIWDSQSEGNLLYQGALDPHRVVSEGEDLPFSSNSLGVAHE